MSSTELDTKGRILSVTWRLLEQNRGRGVRVEDIAAAAGITRQAVYLHFRSRAELLIAAVRFSDEEHGVVERLRALRAASSGVECLEQYVEFWGGYIPVIYGLAKALLALQDSDPDAAAAWKDRMDLLHDACLNTIHLLAREGRLAPSWNPGEAADLMFAMLSIRNWEVLTQELGWTGEAYIRVMQAALKAVFVADRVNAP